MNKTNIAWVDVETTGLNAQDDYLLEIACIITDPELNVLDEEGFHAIVYYSPDEALHIHDKAIPFVQEMHKTGLWAKLSTREAHSIGMVDEGFLDYLQRFGVKGEMPVAGNTVRLDMNFMDEWLPKSAGHLSYHMRDVSTIAGFANDWYDLPWFEKHSDHTAMTDIRESIREAKHYRETVFKTVSETERGQG